jgi:predicted enzyme related to lactoylglutathione lyase
MSLFKDVNVVQYHVTQWERAKQFYTDVLGWPVAFLSDEAGWMEFGEEGKTHLAINRWEESTPVPAGLGGALAVLTVEDAAGTVAALRARGVRCDDAVVIPGMVAYGAFYDPDGNRVQFASSPPGL